MKKRTSTALTTAAIGVAAGAAAYMMTSGQSRSNRRRSKSFKRNANRAINQVGEFIDSVSSMMR